MSLLVFELFLECSSKIKEMITKLYKFEIVVVQM